MADLAEEGGDVFVYRGGEAPGHITHARIDKSVKVISELAFFRNPNLQSVETHDGVEKIDNFAFFGCKRLTHIDIRSVKVIEVLGLAGTGLPELDCDNLEMVESYAFEGCESLRRITLPSLKVMKRSVFDKTALTDVELPKVEQVTRCAFDCAPSLRRISIPLKEDLFSPEEGDDEFSSFRNCGNLMTVELVGGIHKTVSSLPLESWRNDMIQEINRINVTLPTTPGADKAHTINQWIRSVLRKIEHYKVEHRKLLKEAAIILVLAPWKAKLDEKEEEDSLEAKTKEVKIEADSARKVAQVTCGADIIIKNVLPFLELE